MSSVEVRSVFKLWNEADSLALLDAWFIRCRTLLSLICAALAICYRLSGCC
jgi:hypothetical protein